MHAPMKATLFDSFLCIRYFSIAFLSIKGVKPAQKGLYSLLSIAVRVENSRVFHDCLAGYNIGRYMHPNGTS